MATGNFPVPPTYAPPFIQDPATQGYVVNPLWLSWFLQAAQFFSDAGGSGGTIAHNNLAGLQGGAANQFFHLTASDFNNLTGGNPSFAGTVSAANAKFGTFTSLGGIVQTGFITITDAGGTPRRLLVG